MTPPWVGMFVSQIQNRPLLPGKLSLSQLLHVVAPVLRPISCTPQLSMGPPVTYQQGEWDKDTGLDRSRCSFSPVLTAVFLLQEPHLP